MRPDQLVLNLTVGADYTLFAQFRDEAGEPVDMSGWEFDLGIHETEFTERLITADATYTGASGGDISFLFEDIPDGPLENIVVLNSSYGGNGFPPVSGRAYLNHNHAQASGSQVTITLGGTNVLGIVVGALPGLPGAKGDQGDPGVDGDPGPSAYEVAVENGFVGTESDWLLSLIGADGDPGADGDSAYQVAVNNGFVGTEDDWLLSLIGADGDPGADGSIDLTFTAPEEGYLVKALTAPDTFGLIDPAEVGVTDHSALTNRDDADSHPMTAITGLAAALADLLASAEVGSSVAPLESGVVPDSYLPATITRDTELTAAIATAISNVIGGAPGTLDTLDEIAAALADDAAFSTTVTNLIATKVAKSQYDANTILAANSDDTPLALTIGEQTIIGRVTGGSIAALTASQIKTLLAIAISDVSGLQAALDAKLALATYDANTILKADSNDTPTALTVAEQTLVGRITAGVITALTVSQVKTLLGYGISDISGLQAAIDAKVAASLFDANTLLTADTDNTPAALSVAASTLVGRAATGGIDDLSVAQVKTLLAYVASDFPMTYTAQTTTYAAAINDLVNCTSGTFTVTLPTAVGQAGKSIIVKNSGTGVITINTTSSQTMDGIASGSVKLNTQYTSLTFVSNGANWILV